MLVLFVILVGLGAAFSVLFLFTYPQDSKEFRGSLRSLARPIILLVLAIGCWGMSMPAFTAANTTLIQSPSYIITSNSPSGALTTITVASANTTTTINPFTPAQLNLWLFLWLAILGVHLVLCVMVGLNWIADTASGAIEGTD